MNGEDWTAYEFQPASPELLCQFRRKDGFYHVGFAKDFSPEFNVAGLEWKLTGIAREQLERMSPEAQAQVMLITCGWAANNLMGLGAQSQGDHGIFGRSTMWPESMESVVQ